MRRAKIVCTLGPASDSPEVIAQLIHAGMNVARLNFSHGSHDYHRALYKRVRDVAEELNKPVAIMQDLQGPKIRVGKFKDGPVQLIEGNEFVITIDDIEGDQERVSTTYKELTRDIAVGDVLLLDDGLIRLEAIDVTATDVRTIVQIGGLLKNNKGINLPTAAVSAPSMTEKDKIDLKLGLELGVDYIALSFVRSALDIHQLHALIPPQTHDIKIISKIEKPQAIHELEDIISVSDGIMIARGDLGVELPPQKVPLIQKRAIRMANEMGRISITATQMLESMTENARPTRAEASDVANAVLDGTDAVMLSGETAAGKYPVESVRMMASIVEEVEHGRGSPIHHGPQFIQHLRTFPNAVAKAASIAADELNVSAIVVFTESGATARLMMTYRPTKPIVACTPNERVYNQLAMYWGVEAYQIDLLQNTQGILSRVEKMMVEKRGAKSGDEIIIVMGNPAGAGSETNLIKFHRIP
ncbi:pyruvate kinase [Bradymonas sediminis]|uniref:Pyruvate kinase n=1 Tax=Bradymonas sediminis TaxID=1548548 RepID=A0A2Z4FQX4_9DELT|nr:pyruvate kinase [Bradymonas sediminis]AWV91387.1 pyruvate kinase [Bradymonas sediminis]TDP73511.1 pyruvate kinase [Bradymonas sediminis]